MKYYFDELRRTSSSCRSQGRQVDLSVAGAGSLAADIYVSGLVWQGELHQVLAALDSPPVAVPHR
jgi:hypothetical protein